MWIAVFTFLVFINFYAYVRLVHSWVFKMPYDIMTSESIKSISTTNSLFFWVPFLILFFYVFVKHKLNLRLKYVLVSLVFLCSNFYLSTNNSIVYNNVMLCNRLLFYSHDYISTCNKLYKSYLISRLSLSTFWY